MQVVNLNVPLHEKIFFGSSRLDKATGKQVFEERYFPLFCAKVNKLTGGCLLDVWCQVHFATDTFDDNSSAVGLQLRLSPKECVSESPKMIGTPISCYPAQNMKPRSFSEGSGKADYDPIGVYLTMQRAAKRIISADMREAYVVAWAFARSFGAKRTDFITAGGGVKASGSGDYTQMDVAVIG